MRMQLQQIYSVPWGGLCALGGEAVALEGAAVSQEIPKPWKPGEMLGYLFKPSSILGSQDM